MHDPRALSPCVCKKIYEMDMNFYPAKKVAPCLWIGSRKDSEDAAFMRRHDIRMIVNCSNDIPLRFPDIKSYRVPVDDSPDSAGTMAKHLPITSLLIDDVTRYGHNVLVHCYAGMNRSATVAAAYLMFNEGLGPDAAMGRIKRCKPECFQPMNFGSSLRAWEKKMNSRRR